MLAFFVIKIYNFHKQKKGFLQTRQLQQTQSTTHNVIQEAPALDKSKNEKNGMYRFGQASPQSPQKVVSLKNIDGKNIILHPTWKCVVLHVYKSSVM